MNQKQETVLNTEPMHGIPPNDYATDYPLMLDFLVELIEARGKTTLPRSDAYRNDAQVLAIKLVMHLISVKQLAEGSRYFFRDGRTLDLIDHSSVQLLVRSAMETYLVFHYLYGNQDANVNRFRHACWACGGLMDRQSYSINTEQTREQVAAEKKEVEAVHSVIKTNTEFSRYSSKEQAQLLDGNWKVKKEETSWNALAVSAGIKLSYFKDIYGYLSGAAHSSYGTSMQIRTAQGSINAQKRLADGSMRMANLVTGMLISDLRDYLVIPNDTQANAETEEAINRWKLFNEYLHKHYGQSSFGQHPALDPSNTL